VVLPGKNEAVDSCKKEERKELQEGNGDKVVGEKKEAEKKNAIDSSSLFYQKALSSAFRRWLRTGPAGYPHHGSRFRPPACNQECRQELAITEGTQAYHCLEIFRRDGSWSCGR
jgi:hypothetical protein